MSVNLQSPMNARAGGRAPPVRPLIDGSVVDSGSDRTTDVINPSTGAVFLAIPSGSSTDADRAVASARSTFQSGVFSDAPPSARKQLLHRWADLIERDAPLLDTFDAEEMGKPVRETLFNARSAAGLVRSHAEAIDKITGTVYSSDKTTLVAQRLVARGVVVNAVAPCGEGAGHAASWEPARQSGLGTEGGIAGMASYMRRQLLWFNHG